MRGKRCAVRIGVVSTGIVLGVVLWRWTCCAECEIHYCPEYEKIDLLPYEEKLQQGVLTAEEYDVLYEQTGLSQIAVDTLRRENRQDELSQVQERFFAEVETECECECFLFREHMDVTHMAPDECSVIPVLEDGDILITFNSHFLGWRNGHAGMVTDAENGLTLEALTIGRDSSVLPLDSWKERPSFAVMRLRGATKKERAEIAEYAAEHLADIPYRLSAGVLGDRDSSNDGSVQGTHCAHLIWYAYSRFGYDLDGDGGLIVTPGDLYESPLLEVVQVYGMKPKRNY